MCLLEPGFSRTRRSSNPSFTSPSCICRSCVGLSVDPDDFHKHSPGTSKYAVGGKIYHVFKRQNAIPPHSRPNSGMAPVALCKQDMHSLPPDIRRELYRTLAFRKAYMAIWKILQPGNPILFMSLAAAHFASDCYLAKDIGFSQTSKI